MVYNGARLVYYIGQAGLSFVNPEKAKGRRGRRGRKKRKKGKEIRHAVTSHFPLW